MSTATIDGQVSTTGLWSQGSCTIDMLESEFGIGRTTAYALMNEGKLPFSRAYGRRLITRLAVQQMLADGMTGGEQ